VEGDPERAATLLGMAAAVRGRRDRGDLGANATEERLRSELGDARFDELRASGEAVPREDVLASLGVEATGGWGAITQPASRDQTRRR
jgi:hypothetical protein